MTHWIPMIEPRQRGVFHRVVLAPLFCNEMCSKLYFGQHVSATSPVTFQMEHVRQIDMSTHYLLPSSLFLENVQVKMYETV